MDAIKLISTLSLPEEEWLKIRKTGLGGSDIGAISGLSRYSNPLTVYHDKISDDVRIIDNDAMYFGRELESFVAKEFTKRTGKQLRNVNYVLQSKECSWMLANLDRLGRDELGEFIFEAKTVNSYGAKDWKDEEIPESYELQVQWYMMVTGIHRAYIACLIGGQKFVWKEVVYDPELADYIWSVADEFWKSVQARRPPEADGSEACTKLLSWLYSITDPEAGVLDLGGEGAVLARRSKELATEVKSLETEKTECDNKLKPRMKEGKIAVCGEFQLSWKPTTTNRLNTDKLKKAHADIYKECCEETKSRRFTISNKK